MLVGINGDFTGRDDIFSNSIFRESSQYRLDTRRQSLVLLLTRDPIHAPLCHLHCHVLFCCFRERRIDRITAVRAQTDGNRRRYHMGRPLSLARDAVLRTMPPDRLMRRTDQLYGWTPPELPNG